MEQVPGLSALQRRATEGTCLGSEGFVARRSDTDRRWVLILNVATTDPDRSTAIATSTVATLYDMVDTNQVPITAEQPPR